MINPISRTAETALFDRLQGKAPEIKKEIENLSSMGIEQTTKLTRKMFELARNTSPEVTEAVKKMEDELRAGASLADASIYVKPFLKNEAAVKETSLGTAVMAEGWSKPVVFPHEGAFRFDGFVDAPAKVTTEDLWHNNKPKVIIGGVGYSRPRPEWVKGGTSLSRNEMTEKYINLTTDFIEPVIKYLKENGATDEDIALVFAHSYEGVDKSLRDVAQKHNLKGFAITPTEYTQYVKGKEMPATKEFPNGYLLADFPFPTVLTRNLSSINDYAQTYGKMVGEGNPLLVAGGGSHAFSKDIYEALIGSGKSNAIPVDILADSKEKLVIPGTTEDGKTITNAARYMLDRINGNPYEQYRYAFRNFLPSSRLKEDIAQYDPQAAFATAAYAKLAQAGKIGK